MKQPDQPEESPHPLSQTLIELIRRISPDHSQGTINKLAHYRKLILKVNSKINLVSRQETARMVDDLLYDSLALAELIAPKDRQSLLDLGSGAGFPGLVIAIVQPECRLISVEANRRKIEFQRQVARELELPNVELICDRIENIESLKVEVATAKAFSSLDTTCTLIYPHLVTGGSAFLPRSTEERIDGFAFSRLGFNFVGAQLYQSATNYGSKANHSLST